MALVTTLEINGVRCEAHASAQGSWSIKRADTDRHVVSGKDTLDAAKRAASLEIRKSRVRVTVPFFLMDGACTPGVATGIHGQTGEVLAEVGEAKEKETIRNAMKTLKATTPPDVRMEIVKLGQQYSAIGEQYHALIEEHQFRLRPVVERAMEDAMEESSA